MNEGKKVPVEACYFDGGEVTFTDPEQEKERQKNVAARQQFADKDKTVKPPKEKQTMSKSKMSEREIQKQDAQNAMQEQANAKLAVEVQYRTEFQNSPDLQKEFGDVETYMAYKKAEARGLIRGILK